MNHQYFSPYEGSILGTFTTRMLAVVYEEYNCIVFEQIKKEM